MTDQKWTIRGFTLVMLAINPAFETAPDDAPEDALNEELEAARQRLPADICAALNPGQIRRLAMLIAPDTPNHRVSYQVSTGLPGSRYYLALFLGKEKRSGERLEREGLKHSLATVLVKVVMVVCLLATALTLLMAITIFAVYAVKSMLGIDLFDGHFFMHPLLFKLGLLPGSGA